MGRIIFGDNLDVLPTIPSGSVDLIYIDPPFNTGKVRSRTEIRTVRDEKDGDRVGYKGKKYRTIKVGTKSFCDSFDDFMEFLEPRLAQAHRILKPDGRLSFSDHHMNEKEVLARMTGGGMFRFIRKGKKTYSFMKAG